MACASHYVSAAASNFFFFVSCRDLTRWWYYKFPGQSAPRIDGTGAMLWHCTSKNFKVAIHGRTRLCQTTSIFPLHRHVRRPPIRHIKMAMSCRYAARTCARQLRFSSVRAPAQTLRVAATTRRYNSTEAEAATPPNPKIDEIVDQISKLTLLETADLVTSLKVRLIFIGQLS